MVDAAAAAGRRADRRLLDAGPDFPRAKAARSGKYDVIIANTLRYSPWHPRYWSRGPFYTPTPSLGVAVAPVRRQHAALAKIPVPLIAIDMDDAFGIGSSSVFLLDKAKVFFKRELPVDKWQVLYGSVHPHLPTLRYRNSAKWQRRMDTLQPISLPQFRYQRELAHRAVSGEDARHLLRRRRPRQLHRARRGPAPSSSD